MKRVAVFAHHDRDDLVDQYIWYYLEDLKRVSSSIVFVTTSNISAADMTRLKAVCNLVIVRQNIGYDFAGWKMGLGSIENLAAFDELILCNDSVYGPLYPLTDVFEVMSEKPCDFWGITENYEVEYHLQSYFLVFRRGVMISETFREFWSSIENHLTKWGVTTHYEVGLSRMLITQGFKPSTYTASYSLAEGLRVMRISPLGKVRFLAGVLALQLLKKGSWKSFPLNPTLWCWSDLIAQQKMPFLKIQLLTDNPLNINIKGYERLIKRYSTYEVAMIKRHLDRVRR